MNILVTGSSGLIGSAISPLLEKNGHVIRRLDILPPPSENKAKFFKVEDITDITARQNAVKKVDGVIHLAAVSRVLDAEQDPSRCIDINVKGTMDLLHDLAELDSPPWFIYGSSREVYGYASNMPVCEEHPLKPVNIYGESKAAAEYLVRNYARCTKSPAVILRFSNVYGSVHDHATRVIPAFVRASITGSAITINGEDHTFDFTHVDDVAGAISAAVNHIENGRMDGIETINVVSGQGTTLGQLASLVRSVSGKDIPFIKGKPRDFDVDNFIGDPSHLKNLLGVCCKIPLQDGVERLINDFITFALNPENAWKISKNPDWLITTATMQEASL
ncbi:MAG: NAD(P)-dependent oxidoreductase [ANME-2 cluster archaeon]|nr:NAD(P)-dependent oxidoreductase [ANME-2 cluster archaeon]